VKHVLNATFGWCFRRVREAKKLFHSPFIWIKLTLHLQWSQLHQASTWRLWLRCVLPWTRWEMISRYYNNWEKHGEKSWVWYTLGYCRSVVPFLSVYFVSDESGHCVDVYLQSFEVLAVLVFSSRIQIWRLLLEWFWPSFILDLLPLSLCKFILVPHCLRLLFFASFVLISCFFLPHWYRIGDKIRAFARCFEYYKDTTLVGNKLLLSISMALKPGAEQRANRVFKSLVS